jgi:hypothetical protein
MTTGASEELNGTVPVVTEEGKRFFFDERDIRQVCSIMRCGDSIAECLELLKENRMECTLCYAMLKMYKKPYRAKRRSAGFKPALRGGSV